MCFWHTAQRLIRLTTDGPLVIPEGTIPGLPGVSSAAPAAKHNGDPPINVSPSPGNAGHNSLQPVKVFSRSPHTRWMSFFLDKQ